MKSKFILFTVFVSLLCACSEDSPSEPKDTFDASIVCPESQRGTFTDERDGQVYKYTTIGNQVWMAENLNFDNGSPCAKESCSEKGREYTPM
ncbi:FISUMP domain-containing protein, partial [Fibrobacter sp. HC4]|uniref:FISUMP domain-containing protein n=1 Tax=Fibrobacter sp. HC4 TaxID=3239812 RepID=UPI0023DF6A22